MADSPVTAPHFTLPTQTPLPSPCVGICSMNLPQLGAEALCAGCLRTLDEIAHWSVYDENEKRAVWQQIILRQRPTPRP